MKKSGYVYVKRKKRNRFLLSVGMTRRTKRKVGKCLAALPPSISLSLLLTDGHFDQREKTKKGNMKKSGYVYIMTNKNRTTLYIGVTNDLCRRIYEHKNHLVIGSFTDRYNLENCIYYEEFSYFNLAIQREKELKKWNRQKKEDLINEKNPDWKVLVTERGFIRENIPFSKQVADLLNELKENTEAPPLNMNDEESRDKDSSFQSE